MNIKVYEIPGVKLEVHFDSYPALVAAMDKDATIKAAMKGHKPDYNLQRAIELWGKSKK